MLRTLALAALALTMGGCAPHIVPDVVITNARVFTNDTDRPWAEAVAIRGERIVGVGSTAEMSATAGVSTRRIDAGGRVLVPGFNDARVDLRLDEAPTAAALSTLDRSAVTQGVTSLQVVAGGPMRTLVDAARHAERQARWRLIRSPMDGERPQDDEPFLPPQPGRNLQAHGVAWAALVPFHGRKPIDEDDLAAVLGWAYGAEDPIVMSGNYGAWLRAMSSVGLEEVWRRKRPRFDLLNFAPEGPLVDSIKQAGLVAVWRPRSAPAPPEGRAQGLRRLVTTTRALFDAGVVVAFASSSGPHPMDLLATAVGDGSAPKVPGPTREEAVRAMTWGSAYAEKAERDKGWLGVGTLADVAILSDDVFTTPVEGLRGITSVLTMVGGAIVYDPGVLVAAQPH
jgi:Amidohydrolase family